MKSMGFRVCPKGASTLFFKGFGKKRPHRLDDGGNNFALNQVVVQEELDLGRHVLRLILGEVKAFLKCLNNNGLLVQAGGLPVGEMDANRRDDFVTDKLAYGLSQFAVEPFALVFRQFLNFTYGAVDERQGETV